MRVAFAGTPEFAAVALEAILAAGFTVPLVLTQPDRPAGRGMKLQASPVKQVSQREGIALSQPLSLRLDGKYPADAQAAQLAIQAAQIDVMVVAAYGLILPQWVLDAPRLGCLNIHASLLPRWRGAAPIHRAIEAGDAQTGITIMQMDAGLDTGAMMLVDSLPIAPADTTATLHDKLAEQGGQLIVRALQQLAAGVVLPATVQPDEGVCYAHKIDKIESQIDWAADAAQIERRLRAFDPFPGGLGHLDGEAIKIWRAACCAGQGQPGQVLSVDASGVVVACGQGAVKLLELQRAGGKRLPAQAFLQSRPVAVGAIFGTGV
ncbi:MAG: methionyl-tRNA formyltransferase [Burkholderiaceae bacterium]|nr:methionyl-tRNA formyltransferase [Burkholderiaceae bacterium]